MVICLDFDGVIIPYKPWSGVEVFPEPLEGIMESTKKLKQYGHTIIIFTCRKEVEYIHQFLKKYDILYDFINYYPEQHPETNQHKPIADVYIDDKGLTFQGKWDDIFIEQILNFKPWHGRD